MNPLLLKTFVAKVKSYYKDELVYYKEHMPKPNNYNQVYYPVCNHILDMDGLMTYLKTLDYELPLLIAMLDIALFNKDKAAVTAQLTN